MGREVALLVAAAVAGVAPVARGQATGMPSFNAPYRAFQRSEFGAVFSFPDGGGTGIEGAYRYASGKLDVGLRGGIFDPPSSGKAVLLAGVEARERVITHTVDFPLDGAIVFGAGADLVSGGSELNIPLGLSLGRRIDPAPERQAKGDVELRASAYQVGSRAEHDRAVERKIDGMRDHALARLDASEQHGLGGAGRIEDPAPQPDVELAARIAIGALDPGAAAVGKAEDGAELRPLKRAIGRIERRHARRLPPGDRRHSRHGRRHQQRHLTSHGFPASKKRA